jgi:hypothetical protein
MKALKLRIERIIAKNSKHNLLVLLTIIFNLSLLNTQTVNATPGDLEIKDKYKINKDEYVAPVPTIEDLIKIQDDRYYYKPDKVYLIDLDVQLVSEFIYLKKNLRRCQRYKDIKWEVYKKWWYREVYKPDPLRYLIPEEPIRQPKYQNVDIRYVG